MPFSQKQVDMMREELGSIYSVRKSKNTEYSYPTMWDTINDHFEDLGEEERQLLPVNLRSLERVVLLQKDNFRKFVKGQVQNPGNDGMIEAIYFWLTDKKIKDSILSKEAVKNEDPNFNLYKMLSDFLNPNETGNTTFNPKLLQGVFEGELGSGKAKRAYELEISNSITSNVLKVNLSEWDTTNQELRFTGYAVWSEQENMVFLLQDENENLPRILISHSISTEFYIGNKISAFICTDIYYAENIDDSIKSLGELSIFSKNLAIQNSDNSLKFITKEGLS